MNSPLHTNFHENSEKLISQAVMTLGLAVGPVSEVNSLGEGKRVRVRSRVKTRAYFDYPKRAQHRDRVRSYFSARFLENGERGL